MSEGSISEANTAPEESGRRESEWARPVLLLTTFATQGARVVDCEGPVTIGRGRVPDTDGDRTVVLADKLLSRNHLRIASRPGGYSVEDLASLNGTYLDGNRLSSTKMAPLSEGGILFFGHQMAVFRRIRESAVAALAEDAASPFGSIATRSPSLALTFHKLRRLAPTDHELLLVGEAGVGKEVCARAIHRTSGRRGPFVTINCAALPGPLTDRALFGYAPSEQPPEGAKPALIEAAAGGTLLLEEIDDAPPDLQAKIFRFLQDRLFTPFGSTAAQRADVRILATTSGQAKGKTSLELVARFGGEPIRIPALRERPEDIGPLAAHFAGGAVKSVDPAAFRALSLYNWPLNVRELEKAMQRAAALVEGDLQLEHLPSAISGALARGAPVALRRRPRPAPPRAELAHLLKQHHGNVAQVARSLDRKWAVVWRWIGRHQLHPNQFRP